MNVVGVDRFDFEPHPQGLVAFLGNLALEQHVGRGDEVGPTQPMYGFNLRICRGPTARENAGDAGNLCSGSARSCDV